MHTVDDLEQPILVTVSYIAEEIVKSAYWDEGRSRCNWMGRFPVDLPIMGFDSTETRVLGSSLYSGSSGIALFLAELYACTGEGEYKHAALGALRRSIQIYLREPGLPVSPLSFFSGDLGMAYVAKRIDGILGTNAFSEEIFALLSKVKNALSKSHVLDVMAGSAGAIPALLWLGSHSGLEFCLDIALECGQELCERAQWHGESCSWDNSLASGFGFDSAPLTGMAHGAAGMALALLELYFETQVPVFLRTAQAAFAYEDKLFIPELNNWPDLRFSKSTESPVCQNAWCHGAGGIALARARASILDTEHSEHHRDMARKAIQSTLEFLQKNMDIPSQDATLCHGLCGLVQIVQIVSEVLDDSEMRNDAVTLSETLVAQRKSVADWPFGTPQGSTNPSLMLGSAGVGHHLLRMLYPERVPPILVLWTKK
jgi:lantibiotic modifying enzyme